MVSFVTYSDPDGPTPDLNLWKYSEEEQGYTMETDDYELDGTSFPLAVIGLTSWGCQLWGLEDGAFLYIVVAPDTENRVFYGSDSLSLAIERALAVIPVEPGEEPPFIIETASP
jgi:hypothetical protein